MEIAYTMWLISAVAQGIAVFIQIIAGLVGAEGINLNTSILITGGFIGASITAGVALFKDE